MVSSMAEREHMSERVWRHDPFRWMEVIGCLCEIGLYCCCRMFLPTLRKESTGCCSERGLEEGFLVFLNINNYWWLNVIDYSLHQPVLIFCIVVVLSQQYDLNLCVKYIVKEKKTRVIIQETLISQQKSTLNSSNFNTARRSPWISGRAGERD